MADALIGAVKKNDVVLVEQMIGRGLDVNCVDEDGKTSLHWAAYNGFVECAQVLLESKANLYKADQAGWAPLHVASWCGRAKCVKVGCEIGFFFFHTWSHFQVT